MRKEPDIVKELREAEKLGLLHSKAESVYEAPETMNLSSQDIADEDVAFVDGNIGIRDQWGAESFYQSIVEQATVGVVVSSNGRVVFCNKKESEIFGYEKPSDLIGKSVSDIIHKEDIPRLVKLAKQLRNGEVSPHLTMFRGIRADGKEIYVEALAMPFPYGGEDDYLLSFHLDVTAHKKADEKFRETKRRYRLIAENTSDLIATLTFSLNPKYTYVSPSNKKIMGYTSEDLIGKPVFDLIHPDDKKELLRLARKYIGLKGKKLFTGKESDLVEKIEYRIKDKLGNWHYLESTVNVIGNELLVVSRDVTERKRAEENLRDSERKLSQIVDGSPIPALVINKDHTITNWNNALEQLSGLSARDMVGTKNHWKAFYLKRRPLLADLLVDNASSEDIDAWYHGKCHRSPLIKDSYWVEDFFPILGDNGKWLAISATLLKDTNGSVIGAIETLQDITERKKMEEELRESEEEFRLIFQNVNDEIVYVDKHGKIINVNRRIEDIFGYKPEEVIGKNFIELRWLRIRDLLKVVKLFKKAVKGGKVLDILELEVKHKDGRVIPIEASTKPVKKNGKIVGFLSIIRDVTERKKMEEKLRENEDRLKDFLDNANDLIQSVDSEGRFVYVNKKWLKTLGYTMEELKSLTAFDVLRDDQIQHCKGVIERVSRGESFDRVETVFVAKDGREIFVEGCINGGFDENGRFVAIRAIFRDVTDRKKAEDRFMESESRLRTLLDATHDMVLLLDVDGRILYSNNVMAKSLGKNVKDIVNSNIRDHLPSDVYESRFKMFSEIQRTGKPVKFVDTRGSRWFDNVFYPIVDERGRVVQLTVFSRDITDEKKISEALKENEELFRTLVESAPLGIYIYDPFDERFVYVNPTLRKLAKAHGVEGVNLADYLTPESLELVKKRVRERLEGKRVSPQVDVEVIPPDGEKRLVRLHTALVRYKGRKAMLAIVLDLTEEKRMQSLLEENEKKYRSVMESAADGILIVDEAFRIVSSNESAARIFGYNKEEFLGRLIFDIVPEKMRTKFMKGIKRLNYMDVSRFTKRTIEVVGLGKDGYEVPIELSFSMYEVNGRRFFTSIVRDISERKRMERDLREREERYRTIFEASPEAIVLFDGEGYIIDANNRVKEWIGYDRDELLGKSIDNLPCLSSESKKVAMEKLSRRLHSEDISAYDLEFLTKKGRTVFGRVRGTVVRNAEGDIIGTLVMISDVTQQKQFEKRLRESEEKFRVISSAAYDAIIMLDNEGNVSYWNKAAEKIFGYKSEEIIGKNLHKIIVPKDFYIPYKKGFEKFKSTGEGAAVGRTLELPALRKDGTEFSAELSLSSVKIKGKWNAIGIVRDISKRKEIEKEIRIRDEAIKSSINGIAITDSMGNIIYVNNSFLKMWKYDKAEEVIGKPIISFWDINENYRKVMGKLVNAGGWTGELIAKRKDGLTFPVQLSINFVRDENNKINNIFASFVDITEQKKAEEKLLREQKRIKMQNIQLKKLDRIKSEFLNITSHELRTPMSAIKGYAQMIFKEALGPITDEQKKALNVVLRNINRLDNLIRDILDVSRLESGTMKFLPEHVDIKEMVLQVVETMQSSAETKKIQIKTEIQENLPRLFVDPERIKQVIINIINNAIKVSPENSTVIVRVKKDKKDKILFEIQDFGKGIPKNKQKKIFETFYQVDSGMDRKFGGAGLGLAISRGIILSHGGKIWVNSKLGEGSTFKFTLPVKPVINHEERFKEADIFGLEINKKAIRK